MLWREWPLIRPIEKWAFSSQGLVDKSFWTGKSMVCVSVHCMNKSHSDFFFTLGDVSLSVCFCFRWSTCRKFNTTISRLTCTQGLGRWVSRIYFSSTTEKFYTWQQRAFLFSIKLMGMKNITESETNDDAKQLCTISKLQWTSKKAVMHRWLDTEG